MQFIPHSTFLEHNYEMHIYEIYKLRDVAMNHKCVCKLNDIILFDIFNFQPGVVSFSISTTDTNEPLETSVSFQAMPSEGISPIIATAKINQAAFDYTGM